MHITDCMGDAGLDRHDRYIFIQLHILLRVLSNYMSSFKLIYIKFLNVLNIFMQEPTFMEVMFGIDASVSGPTAAPHTHVNEVCVNIHA